MPSSAESPEARAEREAQDELEHYTDLIASDLGPAPGSKVISDTEKIRMWGLKDPNVDYDQLKAALMQGGLPPEMLDEHSDQALVVVKENPEIGQMYSQPLDDRMAGIMATLAEWPFRLSALAQFSDDPANMVKESDRLDQLWMKQQGGGVQASTLPEIPMVGG